MVAAIVVLAALSVTSPIAVVASAWVGGGTFAVGLRGGAPVYALAGALIVTAVAIVATLWATIPGLLRGRRRPTVVALVAVLVLLGISLTGAWAVVVASWLPRPVAVALLALAVIALSLSLARRSEQGKPVVGVAPAVAGVVGAYVGVAAVTALAASGIPAFPRLPWMPAVDVASSAASPAVVPPAPQNPGLAPGEWATIHNDSWMTDAYAAVALPDPATAEVRSFFAGGDCASLVWNDLGEIVAVCVSPTEVRAYILDAQSLAPRAERQIAARPLATDALTNFSGGGYAILDADQRLVTPLPGGIIARSDARTLELIDEFDVTPALLPGEGITSVVPAWDGALWFVGREGTVGLLDPMTGQARSLVAGPEGTPVDIENSFAVVEDGALVVTGAELLLVSAVDGAPTVTWRVAYDRGERRKPGQTSRASGTTPTVFGPEGRYVAITDNADPRMHLLVFDISGPEPVEHCAVPVFPDGQSATENSLIALGESVFVESNYGYTVTAVAGGRTTVPGLARVDVDGDGCVLAWETDAIAIPSLVSKGVAADNAILTYTKDASLLGTDAWWFTAVDAASGDLLWRRLAGIGSMLNNHYAAGYVGPEGSVYIGTISGVVALISAT
jgi:outer membrane protein assembly factor BamB